MNDWGTHPVTSAATPAHEVQRGDVIWAPDDGDWLRVHRIDENDHERTFYRSDGSEATFSQDARVLVRECPS